MEFSKKFDSGLLTGSFILLLAYGLFNFLNLAFHFFMTRYLSVIDYGTLAAILSIVYIISVFSETIQIVITKYSANEKDKGVLKSLLMKSLSKSIKVSVFFVIVYCVVSIIFISKIFNISNKFLLINGLIVFMMFAVPVMRGILQGRRRFLALGTNVFVEGLTKVILGALLVYLGFGVGGALIGIFASLLVAFMVSLIGLKDIFQAKNKNNSAIGIYEYGGPAFIVNLAILVFYSIDIIIAKKIFPAEIVGAYAVASILSKAIFWGTQPVSRALFSLSAKEDKEGNKLLIRSMGITILLVCIALSAFLIFPDKIISIFSGKDIASASGVLFILGIGMGFLSLCNILLFYGLSKIKEIKTTAKIYKISLAFFALIVVLFFSNEFLNLDIISYLLYLFYLLFLIFLFWCYLKKFEVGLMFFVFLEILILFNFNSNIYFFSLAFVISAILFFIGSLFFIKRK